VRASRLRFLAQLCILLAIATSVALLIDSLGVSPAYCSGKAGCHAAKLAAKRLLGSVPLPLLGLIAFWVWLGATTLRGGHWSRRWNVATSIVAATSAIALLAIQAFVLKTFCPFCVTVDLVAIVAAALLLLVQRAEGRDQVTQWMHPIALGALGLVASAAPVAWPHFRPATAVPAQLQEFSVPGRITVVEFVDLSCSHCRELYSTIEQLRGDQSNRINFVRLHTPLRSHRNAREAARVIQCLLPDGQRVEKLTQILFENSALDRTSVIGAAESVGMTEDDVMACWADPASDAAIEDNFQLLEGLGFEGLPTTYVGGERIVGSQPMAVYRAALDRMQRSGGSSAAEGVPFWTILGLLALGIAVVGRRGRSAV